MVECITHWNLIVIFLKQASKVVFVMCFYRIFSVYFSYTSFLSAIQASTSIENVSPNSFCVCSSYTQLLSSKGVVNAGLIVIFRYISGYCFYTLIISSLLKELTEQLPTCTLLQIAQSAPVVNIVSEKASVLGQVTVMQGISVLVELDSKHLLMEQQDTFVQEVCMHKLNSLNLVV